MKSNSSSASDSFEDNLNITDEIVKKSKNFTIKKSLIRQCFSLFTGSWDDAKISITRLMLKVS